MNKIVLIAGASRGLGFFLTKKYLEEGAMVYAGAREIESSLLKELKKEYSDTLITVKMDVSNTESVERAANQIAQSSDKIDILINNAAIHSSSSFKTLEETNLDDCLLVYDVNTVGPLRVVKSFLPFLKKSDCAKIINISSESGSIGACQREKEFDYCMSKAALNMGTKLLSNYLKKESILVLAIQPGWMRTDMGGAKAALDPYETACKLVDMFEVIVNTDSPIFIDNAGTALPW